MPATTEKLSPAGRRAVIAGSIGTVIEYYDFALYGAAAALVFSPLFFPNVSPTVGLLASFATFAVGFVARPLGGLIIAHFGDKLGRKPALLATIIMMGVATVGIGLLPTYETIGIWAPILLVLLRLVQGMGAGAELAGAFTMIIESTPAHRRTFYVSFGSAALSAGLTLASLVFLAVSALPRDVLLGWAWRVPFLASVLIFAVALFIRRRLEETPEFVAAQEAADSAQRKRRVPVVELLRERKREVIIGFFAMTGVGVFSYVLNTYILTYLTQNIGLSRPVALTATICATGFGVVVVPFMGRLGDAFGPGRVFLAGSLFSAVAIVPLFLVLDTADPVLAVVMLTAVYVIGWGAMSGCHGPFLAALFEPRYRFTGLSLTREVNSGVFSGTAPFVAAALVGLGAGRPWYLVLYMILACGVVTPIAILAGLRRPAQLDELPKRADGQAPVGSGPSDGPDPATAAPATRA